MPEIEVLLDSAQKIYLRVNEAFKKIIQGDPTISREDSARSLIVLISEVKHILIEMNAFPVQERTKYFNVTYNAIVYISDIATVLRKSNYGFECIKDLLDCVLAMEANIILQDAKYLDKRTKIYLDICHIYEENEMFEPAVRLLDSVIKKYKELRELHEMDPPIPTHIDTIITNNLNIIKLMFIKYSIQGNTINPNDWRKKVDEDFGNNTQMKLLSLVQCLKTETRKQSNIFQKSQHSSLSRIFKETLIQAGFQLIKPSAQILMKALQEQKQKIERQIEFLNTRTMNESNLSQQELINEEIKKKRQAQLKYTKENDYKKASKEFPFEYHAEMINYAYEVKNKKVLDFLMELALLRVQCRRIQMPYVNDIGIIASSTQHPNIPNGYEKIPTDLNEANMKIQLRKLRRKKQGSKQEEPPPAAKDSKKGGKDAPPPQKEKPSEEPTEEELEQIKHKYVFMIIKKTMSPQNAVYGMNIIMGDEEQGPAGFIDTRRIIIPYIKQDVDLKQSKVKQYKGIKETTHMAPYIILWHSKTSLEDQDEKKTLLIDVKPLVGKNPMVPPDWGYTKIPVDLRQVPQEFINQTSHEYVYITYKNDEQFHISSRHIKILNALKQLDNSVSAENTADTPEGQKLLQLEISYDLEKLEIFFATLQECLQGKLGQQYYISKLDFLTHLTYFIWTKYMRNPLIQFDYVNELKLGEQLTEYEYKFYREIVKRCKPIFLNGLKILNFIMINNSNSDVLLLSRITLQLLKFLEDEQQYKIAADSGRMCLERMRIFRDIYLTSGTKGNHNKLLPFSLTCSNHKLNETISSMKKKYREQRLLIEKIKRMKMRKAKKEEALSEEQVKEEEEQFEYYRKNDEVDETIEKVESDHSQIIALVAAIELDILNIFFRVSLKHADLIKKQDQFSSNGIINGIRENDTIGLATSTKQKLSLPFTKNEQKNQKNLKQLQTTLIQADKLAPPKPGLHKSQKKLIEEFQKNPYAFSLLMANFAAMYSQSEDKKYFLKEAFDYVRNCINEEKQNCDRAVENSVFLFSTLWDDGISQTSISKTISPFKQLYDGTWPCDDQNPQQPILILKNSTSISMKIPPFRPMPIGKKKRTLKYMSLYGKPSANGVDVSTNCNELEGTGLKNELDEVVTVTNLKQNSVYCFAVAPTNNDQELQNIGKTSADVSTSNPLPIPMIAAYLGKISYQINEYEIAQRAARIILEEYCEKTGYTNENEIENGLYLYKFNEKKLKHVSLLQLRSIAESLYILGLCERKRILEMRESQKRNIPQIFIQEREKVMTNYLMLSALLNPSLTAPINSIPYLIPDQHITLKALVLSLIPPKWLTSKHKELGIKVMQKIMKWGLARNEISMARRILYKWSERKYMMLGKIIQVEQKKQVKKGAKEPKDQQVKMIDKYCRMLIEKNVGKFDMFEDELGVMSEEYSDFVSMFVERAKEQISYFAQFVDNQPQQLEEWNTNLSLKLDLVEYLKEPLTNIKKIGESSQFYLEYNCKLLKKAIEIVASGSNPDYKPLLAKSEELTIPTNQPKQITLGNQIKEIILQSISLDIQWSPESKNQMIRLQEKTGKNLNKQIQLYSAFEDKFIQLTTSLHHADNLANKSQDYDYWNMWLGELYYLKSVIQIASVTRLKSKKEQEIRNRYDKIRVMNLQDLLKKNKQLEILEREQLNYQKEDQQKLKLILKYIIEGCYCCYSIQNWIKLQNNIKLVYNLISKHLITPFYHKGVSQIWQYLAFLSLMAINMLKDVRKHGFDTFKDRYSIKQSRTQLKIISDKLGMDYDQFQVVHIFTPTYYLPQLDPNTTKNFWFSRYEKQNKLDIESIGSIIAYTVQTLQIQEKHNLSINLTRQFCNITQHYYSLQFLPFMICSQQNLISDVRSQVVKQKNQLSEITNQYTKKKAEKPKGERQLKLSNTKLPYEIEFENKSRKLKQSMDLLTNYENFLEMQIRSSQSIIEEIKRDTSKTVIKQREQRKYMLEFGDDQLNMFKNYGQDNPLLKNRKSALKDIIEQYERIYRQLKNSKTSKDPLAEINNRNDVGNLFFATGNTEKANQFWNDALATIFKTVHPVDNYLTILSEHDNKRDGFLVEKYGQKEILLALNLLFKISMFGSFKQLYIQYNCTEFACRLAYSLFETSAEHPQTLLAHRNYRLTKISQNDPFLDEYTINISELLHSLEYFILKSIDVSNNSTLKSLPLVNLYEHISIDIIKNVELSVRSRLLKIIVLSGCGQISEAFCEMGKIMNEKDLPNLWVQNSEYIKREMGVNWYFEQFAYDNSKFWNQSPNKQAIDWLKKTNLKPEQTVKYGILAPILFQYCKALILLKIHSLQIFDNYDLNQQRIQNVIESEIMMRSCLKKLGVLQEFYCELESLQKLQIKSKKNQLNEEVEKEVNEKKNVISSYLKNNGVEDNLINELYFKEQSTTFKRCLRIQFMSRIRFSLFETYAVRKLSKNSYFVLKNGLINLHRYSYGARNVEKGVDPEIAVSQPVQQTDKKNDKKGGKKDEPVVEQHKVDIDWKAQKELQQKNQDSLKHRPSINPFWYIKYLYELIKISFKQGNYQQCVEMARKIQSQECSKFQQHYYQTFIQGYEIRSLLKLGKLNVQKFIQLIHFAEQKKYSDKQYLELVMDVGEILGGEKAYEFYEKGVKISEQLWKQFGMKLVIDGLNLHNPQRTFTKREMLSAQQDEQIMRKNKKNTDKKGGKDDKKAAKKEDPKKKKEQSKAQYKVEPLSKFQWWNLLNEQKESFQNYILKPHPNFHKNNLYSTLPLLYTKSYIWYLINKIQFRFSEQLSAECSYLGKLLKIIEGYPISPYWFQVHINYCMGEINKNIFMNRLKSLVSQKVLPNNKFLKIQIPYDDLPLNNQLLKLPEYSGFIHKNRELLVEAASKYKKVLQIIQNSCLLFQNSTQMGRILWKSAQNMLLLAEYRGRLIPKYFPLDLSADAQQEDKVEYLNQISEGSFFLQNSMKVVQIIEQIRENYVEISAKPLQANAKIDQDIINEILDMDQIHKSHYPQFLVDSLKNGAKTTLTVLDLICFMMKAYRDSEFMTYSNDLQTVLFKIHRILLAGGPGYKEKCVISNAQFVPKKAITDTFIEKDSLFIKSMASQTEEEKFIYILGQSSQSEGAIYYGKVNITQRQLSQVLERLYALRSKMAISSKKSEAVKQRDFTLYRKELLKILLVIARTFCERVHEDHIDERARKVELSEQNLSMLISIFESSGRKGQSKELNELLRLLHEYKYRLKEL